MLIKCNNCKGEFEFEKPPKKKSRFICDDCQETEESFYDIGEIQQKTRRRPKKDERWGDPY